MVGKTSHNVAAVCPKKFNWILSPRKHQDLYKHEILDREQFCSIPPNSAAHFPVKNLCSKYFLSEICEQVHEGTYVKRPSYLHHIRRKHRYVRKYWSSKANMLQALFWHFLWNGKIFETIAKVEFFLLVVVTARKETCQFYDKLHIFKS
jgi:hypothetical protein